MKKGKLRVADKVVAFYCKACKCYHGIDVDSTKTPNWSFNEDYEKPTFIPSVLISNSSGVCHSFITNGRIQYLHDCTHELVGKIIDLE